MTELPSPIRALYRLATANDVRSWSFGQLRAVRTRGATSWQQMRFTLDDQRIFGPIRDFFCACGKYRGKRFENMICDRCGVKIAPTSIRRSRFGHVELSAAIPHPAAHAGEIIEAYPILPAAFFRSAEGVELADLYEDLVRTNDSGDPAEVASVIGRIHDLLVPIVIQAHHWNLQDAETLARGLCLVRETPAVDERCEACGYPLAGLDIDTCPGCGRRIERGG